MLVHGKCYDQFFHLLFSLGIRGKKSKTGAGVLVCAGLMASSVSQWTERKVVLFLWVGVGVWGCSLFIEAMALRQLHFTQTAALLKCTAEHAILKVGLSY